MISRAFSTLSPTPLVLALALAFPVAQAASTVQANGSFADEADYLAHAKSGAFTQPATDAAFDASAIGAKVNGIDNSTTVRAVSDGAGHFGAEIVNDRFYGSFAPMTAETHLVYADSIVNTSGTAQAVSFDLNISYLKFAVQTGTLSNRNYASFEARVFVGGALVPVWSAGFSLNNTGNGMSMVGSTTGFDMGLGAALNAACGVQCGMFGGFSISSSASTTLDLGTVADGDTLSIRYEVDLATETTSYGGAASVFFADPAGLAAGGGSALAPSAALSLTTPVPEPDSAALLAAGLGLMAAAARRRRSA